MRAILNVENWSRFTLLDSQTDIHCGAVLPRYQATNIYPGYREVMLGVGTEIFGGTCGTVSWQVRHLSVFGLQLKLDKMSPHVGGTKTEQFSWETTIVQFLVCFQIVELSVRLIVMWSVPFNLNLYDTYLGLAMIYNQVTSSSCSSYSSGYNNEVQSQR